MPKRINEGKIRRRRIFIRLSIFIISLLILVSLVLRSNYFVIKNVEVENNYLVTKEEISLLSGLKGKNIFLINKNATTKNILVNPYIEGIVIERKLPSTAIIEVNEKKIRGIVNSKNGFISVDSNGKMVQVYNHFPDGKIPLILGVGEVPFVSNEFLIKDNNDKRSALNAVLTTMSYRECQNYFYSIDISDPLNILYTTKDGTKIRIGDWNNIDYKIAYAISISKNSSVKGLKGYIQVQSDGIAVFKKN